VREMNLIVTKYPEITYKELIEKSI
jgi:hypothetical protein